MPEVDADFDLAIDEALARAVQKGLPECCLEHGKVSRSKDFFHGGVRRFFCFCKPCGNRFSILAWAPEGKKWVRGV